MQKKYFKEMEKMKLIIINSKSLMRKKKKIKIG